MKRCWLGGAVLIVLLIAGLLTGRWMGQFHGELSEQLRLAAALTESSRESAQQQADQAFAKWNSRRKFAAVLADHDPMEQIEEYFALLTPEAETEDFRETCLRLAQQLEALGHSQLLTWENLF